MRLVVAAALFALLSAEAAADISCSRPQYGKRQVVSAAGEHQASDGRWVAVACTNDRMFDRLLQAMGRQDLAGRYRTMADRLAARKTAPDGVGVGPRLSTR